jgi:glycosyltransferase involved in cell wall biosynthesis
VPSKNEAINFKLSVIIPTRNRPKSVKRLLENIASQSVKPELVVLIDSSDFELDLTAFPKNLNLKYKYSRLKSAAHQRNMGLIEIYKNSIDFDFVSFLDDDVEIPNDYFAYLIGQLVKNNAVGISGIASADYPKKEKTNNFQVSEQLSGRLMKGALNMAPRAMRGLKKVEWLIGCSIWRVSSLSQKEFFFQGDFLGQSIFEDVIFSHEISHFGKLIVDTDFVFSHQMDSSARPSSNENAADWVLNRFRQISIDNCSNFLEFNLINSLMLFTNFLKQIWGQNLGHDVKGLLNGLHRINRSL